MRIKDYDLANNIHPNDVLIIDGPDGTRAAKKELIVPEVYEAEAWANGTMDGVPVPEQHRAYHNNAKYHAQNASDSATSANASKVAAAESETNASTSEANAAISETNAATSETNAATSETNAAASAVSANASKEAAETSATSANQNALKAEGLAIGEQNGTPVGPSSPYYNNSAKHWADIAKQYGAGGMHYKGSIYFADIPTTDISVGDMYNIKDDFITDSRFEDGSGIEGDAGTNIIWNVHDKWDIDVQGGGKSSGGHTIVNESGTELTQRSKLQFKGASVSDDSTNNTTIVEIEDGFDANIVAPVETSPSAHAYKKGEQFIYDDKLYKATRNIAVGDSIVLPGDIVSNITLQGSSVISKIIVDGTEYTNYENSIPVPVRAGSTVSLYSNHPMYYSDDPHDSGTFLSNTACHFIVPDNASGNVNLYVDLKNESKLLLQFYNNGGVYGTNGWLLDVTPVGGEGTPIARGNCILSDAIVDQLDQSITISYAEYQQLTPEEQANGDYYIPDYPSQPGYADNAPREGSQAYVTSDGLNNIIGNADISSVGTTLKGAIANLSVKADYSTTEKVVGTWIDGKPIYQKTYYLLHQSVGSDIGYVSIDTSDINSTLSHMVNLQGTVDFLANNVRVQRIGNGYYKNGDDIIYMMLWGYSPVGIGINTQMKHPSSTYSDFNFYATIQYTKTTD